MIRRPRRAMIAGAMAENDKIAYAADFPIYGTLAEVNAFARGAQMTNPRAKIYLHWNCIPGQHLTSMVEKNGISIVSDVNFAKKGAKTRRFGLYKIDQGCCENLAAPIWNWGIFYEKIIRDIVSGSWADDERNRKAMNYWWGISGGIIDLIESKRVPKGLSRLVGVMRSQFYHGFYLTFEGEIHKQDGTIIGEEGKALTAEQIITMDWLHENVIGSIPEYDDLNEEAKALVAVQGIIKPKEEMIKQPTQVAARRPLVD